MARTISPKHELQRDEILERAAAAFAAHGYPGTSMNDLAQACGTSKARLYHYYPSKEAILFDLLDRYTRRLIAIATKQAAAAPVRRLHHLIGTFLAEYEHSQTRHIALLNDVKFLDETHRAPILDAQRRLVAIFSDAIKTAYPDRIGPQNKAALTMILFGMINWTFTWLNPGNGGDGKLSYADFAAMVEAMFTRGIEGMQAYHRALHDG